MAIPKNMPGGGRPNPVRRPQQNPTRPVQPSQEAGNRPVSGQRSASERLPEGAGGRVREQRPQSARTPSQPSQRRMPASPASSSEHQVYDYSDGIQDEIRVEPRPRKRVQEPVVNEYDELDDPFETLSIDEQIDYMEEDEVPANKRAPKSEPEVEEEYFEEEDDYGFEDEEEEPVEEEKPAKHSKKSKRRKRVDKKGNSVYINEKENTLKPYGGGKGGKKLKEHEFDRRKNMRKNAVIVQGVIIALLVALVGLGVKNSLFPPDAMTEEQVAEIAAITSGLTNFPLEEGKGFSENFMQAYLTANSDAVSSRILGYYYTGSMTASESNTVNRSVSNTYKQTILYGPTVYEAYAFNSYSARYTIGALIQPAPVSSDGSVETPSPRWEFFNVNVYHDSASDRFTITNDSPTVVPAVEVGEVSKLPARAPLGTGEASQDLAAAIQPVVYGFLQGYAISTPTDYSTLTQYITDEDNPELTKGLDNIYDFAGTVNDSVQIVAYPAVEGSTDEVKALITVRWANKLGGSDSSMRIEYTSTYVATLEKVGGKYLVSRFQPQYYDSEKAEELIVANSEG